MFKLNHISVQLACKLANYLSNSGTPTENRVLILSPRDQELKVGSLIVPGTAKEGVPREGVAIMAGPITDEYRTYKPMIATGMILTYGLYAGKEVDLWDELEGSGIELSDEPNNHWEFTVLSLNEIIYVRKNGL